MFHLLPSNDFRVTGRLLLAMTFVQAESVTVFAHMLHMHENGQMMQTRQYRNDSDGIEQLIHTTNVEYYSFLQAGGHMMTFSQDVTIEVNARLVSHRSCGSRVHVDPSHYCLFDLCDVHHVHAQNRNGSRYGIGYRMVQLSLNRQSNKRATS